MGQTTEKLFNRTKIKTRVKILLRNAIISSALTYALQTHGIAEHGERRINSFTFPRTRLLGNKNWINETHKPQKYATHVATKQPTATSWINKLRIMHMLRQTANGRSIRNAINPYVQTTNKIWQDEWGKQKKNSHKYKNEPLTHAKYLEECASLRRFSGNTQTGTTSHNAT